MTEEILQAMEASDKAGVTEQFRKEVRRDRHVWEIHLAIFPMVPRVLNPLFFNACFPKMYSICRDLAAHLNKE